ncbi:TAP-like protein-domain-containing protein [Roridomyces roridus]|uniref:TAP-like protein-domain-containing protein n=1 Tax=Roridomyces roridus TaxID=1738132 RepID=A0AAD7B766_9AGAR|nr:TAP-like protein-domain-containing protein [Roridomyces roridus]
MIVKVAVAALILSWLEFHGVLAQFNWTTLTATDTLTWTPCYPGFQCSLLAVPLDYDDPSKGNASIAITRLPSTAPPSEYLGPILFNPGGPGGPGVGTVVLSGAAFAQLLGPQFDIVGFDPRGVTFSTPRVDFFATAAERQVWMPPDLNLRYPSLNSSSDVLPHQWAQYQLISQWVAQRDAEQGSWMQYITTDNVARDMLRIVQAFGQEKLQYWGISYGSVLGSTFATLFPDKVGRMVIDGVVEAGAWYSGNLTLAMLDTDKALESFFTGCADAGPSRCAFHAPTASQIASNLASLTHSIHAQPFPVLTPFSHGIVDFSFLRDYVFAALDTPYASFVGTAVGLADLAAGNATPPFSAASAETPQFECSAEVDAEPFFGNTFEAQIAIGCGDFLAYDENVTEVREFYENEAKLSSFADNWALWRIWCNGWKIHREGRFMGPVGATNTSYPLLIIGNTADPLTPHLWAQQTAEQFPGSVLLTQDSPGHTSLVAPSLCTHGALAAYFQNGTLPAPGTVCAADAELFPAINELPSNSNSTLTSGVVLKRSSQMSEEDVQLLEAVRAIGDAVLPVAPRGLRKAFKLP